MEPPSRPPEFTISRFLELGEPGLELLELGARAREHLALHVEFLARHQVEAAERRGEQRAQVFLEVRGRTARENFPHLAVDFLE
jgi:hypothetical protein